MTPPLLHAFCISIPTTCILTPLLSFSAPRRHLRRRLRRQLLIPAPSDSRPNKLSTSSSDDPQETLKLTLDLPYLSSKAHALVSTAREAYFDLQTLISTDEDGKLVVSCKRDTLRFTRSVVVVGVVSLVLLRVLARMVSGVGVWFRKRSAKGKEIVVVRRDRGLGGREVVVGKREARARVLENPVSDRGGGGRNRVSEIRGLGRPDRSGLEKLPEWWPKSFGEGHGNGEELEVDKEFFRREANRLVRGQWTYCFF